MADLRVFAKTPKGAAELAARSGALTQAQRRLLILIDGMRNVEQLSAIVPSAFDDSLTVLEDSGFIAMIGGTANGADTVQGPVSALPEAEMTSVAEARMRAVRAINDLLGPAADRLAMAIEAASSGEELRPLIREAEQLVALAHGAGAAQAFIDRIRRR